MQITKTKLPLTKPNYDEPLPFGVHNTDHLLEIDYEPVKGWGKPTLSPYHNLSIDPKNSTLHYAIQLFEGMKAYRSSKNSDSYQLNLKKDASRGLIRLDHGKRTSSFIRKVNSNQTFSSKFLK